MKKLIILQTIILFVLLPVLMIVACQQQPALSPIPPAPSAPTPIPVKPGPKAEHVPNQIIVKFKPGTSIEAEEQLNRSLGTSVINVSTSVGFKVLQIPEGKTVTEMVEIYLQQPIVEYAEPNYIIHLNPESH